MASPSRTPEPVLDWAERAWRFELNILGMTLLLFAAGYIGKHLAVIWPEKGTLVTLGHYTGEIVLTLVAILLAGSRALAAIPHHRHRVAWLGNSLFFFYLGLGAVLVKLVVLGVSALSDASP